MKFRNLILQIHLYLGLISIPYLLIFGITSLNLNHEFLSEKSSGKTTRWERNIRVPPQSDEQRLAEALQDSLDLYGWYLPWTISHRGDTFQFEFTNPGKDYRISAVNPGSMVFVEETPKPVSSSLFMLHALGGDIPAAPLWVNVWKYYQDLTVYSMIFWAITGIYLWITRRKITMMELSILTGMLISSVFLIFYLWLRG